MNFSTVGMLKNNLNFEKMIELNASQSSIIKGLESGVTYDLKFALNDSNRFENIKETDTLSFLASDTKVLFAIIETTIIHFSNGQLH